MYRILALKPTLLCDFSGRVSMQQSVSIVNQGRVKSPDKNYGTFL